MPEIKWVNIDFYGFKLFRTNSWILLQSGAAIWNLMTAQISFLFIVITEKQTGRIEENNSVATRKNFV